MAVTEDPMYDMTPRATPPGPEPSQASLHLAEYQFRTLLDKLPAAAYICDAEGLITYFNDHARHFWGREPRLNDPVDRYCGSFKLFSATGEPVRHEACWMALALRNGREYNGNEILIERPDGTQVTAIAHANPIRDDQGRLLGAVNVLVDITDRKRAEDALKDADRRKNEFMAMLAHELRNPLAPILNGLQIIGTAGDDAAAIEKARDMMERQVGQMVRLIDDLLDVSRITMGKIELRKERMDLSAAIQDALDTSRLLIEGSSQKLHVSIPPGPIAVNADRARMAQVFSNLLNNASKYTPPGGSIELHVERQGSDVVVSVKDNGVGIPADMLPRIFEMFTQVDPTSDSSHGGLGIGLSLVKGLVEMHKGSVNVRSGGRGQGSEFEVRLPLALKPVWSTASAGAEPLPPTTRFRILVVDDNVDSAVSLGMMLKIMGHEPRIAHDGHEAVDAAAEFEPEVLLLDIGLPKLNGYEVCRKVRETAAGKDAVVIALSGWGQEDDKARSREAGFNYHMVKPVDPAALGKFLAGLLIGRG